MATNGITLYWLVHMAQEACAQLRLGKPPNSILRNALRYYVAAASMTQSADKHIINNNNILNSLASTFNIIIPEH